MAEPNNNPEPTPGTDPTEPGKDWKAEYEAAAAELAKFKANHRKAEDRAKAAAGDYEAQISELNGRIKAIEDEKAALEAASKRKEDAAAIAEKHGLPVSLIFGETAEEMEANASAIKAHFAESNDNGRARALFKDTGKPAGATAESGSAALAHALFGKE